VTGGMADQWWYYSTKCHKCPATTMHNDKIWGLGWSTDEA
jgi:hypothetical protein